MRRMFILAVSVAAIVAALAFLPGAFSASGNSGLYAYVVASTRGPLHACYAPPCPDNSIVTDYIFVANGNAITNLVSNGNGIGHERDTVPNAYVIQGVTWTITVNGTVTYSDTFTPPPIAHISIWSGRWPSTVTCTPPIGPPPCNTVNPPAILPHENTVALYFSWAHGSSEPDGTYVFTYTVHGTLNGAPVDLTASAPPIQMTR